MKSEMETGHFKGKDGLRLFYRCWRADRPKAVLAFCHGLAEHSDRYRFPVDYFTDRQFTSYLLDLRGHGYSEGLRGYADSLDDFLEDLRLFLKFIQKREPGRKIFIVSHSFGGQLVLNLLAGPVNGLAGALFSSPNIRLVLPVPLWKRLAARWLSLLWPKLSLGNELTPEGLSHDPDVVEAWRRDPQIQHRMTTRLGQIILENQDHLPALAEKIRLPTLFMHGGDDPVCSAEGTRDFYESVSSSDKSLKVYKGFYHEIFNEVAREKVFRDMEKWIEERV